MLALHLQQQFQVVFLPDKGVAAEPWRAQQEPAVAIAGGRICRKASSVQA